MPKFLSWFKKLGRRGTSERRRGRLSSRRTASPAQSSNSIEARLNLAVARLVIFIVLLMLFVLPYLSREIIDRSVPQGLSWIKQSFDEGRDPEASIDTFCLLQKPDIVRVTTPDGPVTFTPDCVRDADYFVESDFREMELYTVVLAGSSDYTVVLDQREEFRLEAGLNLGLTCFVIFLFFFGVFFVARVTQRLVLNTFSGMLAKIREICGIVFAINILEDDALHELHVLEGLTGKLSNFFKVQQAAGGVNKKITVIKNPMAKWTINVTEQVVMAFNEHAAMSANANHKLKVEDCEELQSFDNLLDNATAVRYFKEFVAKEFSEENMLFYQDCVQFKRDVETVMMFADQIHQTYIVDGSTEQVNLNSATKKAVMEQYKHVRDNDVVQVFAAADKEVHKLMSTDTFPRFLKSDMCQSLIGVLALEKRYKERTRNRLKPKPGKGAMKGALAKLQKNNLHRRRASLLGGRKASDQDFFRISEHTNPDSPRLQGGKSANLNLPFRDSPSPTSSPSSSPPPSPSRGSFKRSASAEFLAAPDDQDNGHPSAGAGHRRSHSSDVGSALLVPSPRTAAQSASRVEEMTASISSD